MASSINASTSGAGGLITTADNTGILNLQTAGTTAVTVDASQNVLIGATSASGFDSGADNLIVGNGSGSNGLTIYTGTSGVGTINFADGNSGSAIYAGGINYNHSNNRMAFYTTDGTGRMFIDSTGNLLIGASTNSSSTSTPKVYVYAGADANTTIKTMPCGLLLNNAANTNVSGYGVSIKFQMSDSGEAGKYSAIAGVGDSQYANTTALAFYTNPNGTNGADNVTQRMYINGSGSIGAPSGTNIYNASDIRLKQNINTIENGLDVITALNPVTFNWVHNFCKEENDKLLYGFIAQEVQKIDTHLVEPFGLNNTIYLEDKTIEDPLRVNEKFIVPYLVKAIQEQQTIINDLKARVTALEAK